MTAIMMTAAMINQSMTTMDAVVNTSVKSAIERRVRSSSAVLLI